MDIYLNQYRFLDEIKGFMNAQRNSIRQARNDDVCKECIANLKAERDNLKVQDRMLRTGEAYLTAAVKLYEDNGKTFCCQSFTTSSAVNTQAAEMIKAVHALVINMQDFSTQ